jgi:hypothetical protein
LENARRAQATAKQTLSRVGPEIKGFLAKHRAKACQAVEKPGFPRMAGRIQARIHLCDGTVNDV